MARRNASNRAGRMGVVGGRLLGLACAAGAWLGAVAPASGQYVMLIDSTADKVILLSQADGSVVNSDFILDAGGSPFDFDTPKEAIQVGNEIWISDQTADAIFCFSASLNPVYIRTISGQLDNIRGLGLVGGFVFVSNDGAGNGATADSIAKYDLSGNRVDTYSVAVTSPFDCEDFNGDVLVPDFTSSSNILQYNTDGSFDHLFGIPTGTLIEQVTVADSGPAGALEVWAATFTTAGVGRFDAAGTQLNFYTGLGANLRGVWVLDSGEVLISNSTACSKFDPAVGTPSTIVSGGGYQFFGGLSLNTGPGANVSVSMGAPPGCGFFAGAQGTYSIIMYNFGNDDSGAVTLTVDLPPASTATYASASPSPDVVTGTQLTFNLAAIPGLGGPVIVSVTLDAVGAGQTATLTATAAIAADTHPANNTAAASKLVLPAVPATAAARGILSDNAALANSANPSGGLFVAFDRPFASPAGTWWGVRADTDLATTMDSVLVRVQTGMSPATGVQEGVTGIHSSTMGIFDAGFEIDDAGTIALAGDDSGATASDEFVTKIDAAGTVTDVAREGSPCPATGVNYGTASGSPQIFSNGNVGFSFTSSPTGSTVYAKDNGTAFVARLGITVPTGVAQVIDTMVTNTTGDGGVAFDASGSHSIYQADVNTGATTDDQVIVADGTVVLQEGVTVLSGLSSTPSSAAKVFTMGPGGVWMVRGTNSDANEDWVIRGSGSAIQQVYKRGDPIHTGATDTWDQTQFAATFFAQLADGDGNYIIGGLSSGPDTLSDAVIVYNNDHVLVRENDPVDLDNDGMFDDGVYINTFGNDDIAFVEGGVLITVTLRDQDAALCGINVASVGDAVIFVPIATGGAPGACCVGAACTIGVLEADCTGVWDAANTCAIIAGPPHSFCCPTNYNRDLVKDVADIFADLSGWFSSVPASDWNGNTIFEIGDIFGFLGDWFVPC